MLFVELNLSQINGITFILINVDVSPFPYFVIVLSNRFDAARSIVVVEKIPCLSDLQINSAMPLYAKKLALPSSPTDTFRDCVHIL